MKSNFFIFCLHLLSLGSVGQQVENTSFTNSGGERVLRLEAVLPVDIKAAWKLFTTDEGLQKWIAPVAHIELKTGGYIVTNYDKMAKLTDSTSIKLPVINFLDGEMIVLKVNLNNNFTESVRQSDQNLQEIIQLKKIDGTHTKIISTMVGFGEGNDWNKTYDFFVKGNIWTYKELLQHYR